ncbi:MAG: DUF4340 domain-containing protein [Eisenbergiella sp.]
MMKKQKIQMCILLAVCGLCVGGYFAISRHEFEIKEELSEVLVTDFNKDDVTGLTVSGDYELKLVKGDDGVWREESIPEETIKQESVNILLSEIDNITTSETVIEAPEDLSQYGLDEPFRTITAELSDGTSVTLCAGAKSDLLSKYYVKTESGESVYMVDSYIVEDFAKMPEELVEEETTGTEDTGEETETGLES